MRRARRRRSPEARTRRRVERQEALGKPAHRAADRLTETGIAETAADPAANGSADRAERIADKSLRRKAGRGRLRDVIGSSVGLLRAGVERQEALRETAHRAADRLAQSGVAEAAADEAAERRPDRAKRIADDSLRRKPGAAVCGT